VNWLHLVSSVRCLACGAVYPKPSTIGTADSNPGCPRCSYVGWAPADTDDEDEDEIMEGPAQLRFGVGLLHHRFWRAG
jgi:hypothetical protein